VPSVSAQRPRGGSITRRCIIAVTRTVMTPSSGLPHGDELARRATGFVRREEVPAERTVLSAARSRIGCRGGAPPRGWR